MSDPFKAVHADLVKAVKALRNDAETKFKAFKLAESESNEAVTHWQEAQKRLETFEREVLNVKAVAAPKAASAKKTAKATATVKKAKKKKAAKTVAKKAAPKAKTKAKAKSKAAPKAKAKAKAKSKAKTRKKPTKKAVANAAAGREAVASGARPPLKKAIATIIGTKVMDAGQVLAGLEEKGWVPSAGNPRQYLSFVLSSSKDWFERTEKRGEYRVRPNAPVKDGSAKKKSKAKATKKKAAAKAPATTPTATTAAVDSKLGDLGLGNSNVQPNPFANA